MIQINKIPDGYDSINHLALRSDFENDMILGTYLVRNDLGTIDCLDKNKKLLHPYVYASETEFEQDCKILGL